MTKEIWCGAKAPENEGGRAWQGVECHKCCVFCPLSHQGDDSCPLRTCGQGSSEDLCCWRCSPAEWMLGRIDGKAENQIRRSRQVEFWERQGFREGDGSWEGDAIRDLRERYGKDFGRVKDGR